VKSAPTTQRSTSPSANFEDRAAPPRLQLKPKSTIATGYVDGGWWPRSHDLEAELPALLALLAVRLGSVERVSYHLGDWGSAAKAINAGGGFVRLSGFRSQTAGTIDVLGPRQRITLLVVPPETSSQTAHDVMAIAARRDNADGVASLLRSAAGTSETVQLDRGEREIARRTLDGGVIAERV
jgi:Family of unknown function (DUF5994)